MANINNIPTASHGFTVFTNYGPFNTHVRTFTFAGRTVQATLKNGILPSGTTYTRTTYMIEMAGTMGGPFTKKGVRAMLQR